MEQIIKKFKLSLYESANNNGRFKKVYVRTVNYQKFIVQVYPKHEEFDISTPERMLFSGKYSEMETVLKNFIGEAERSVNVKL
jgi:hypothetical protein